jgi:hypothetical protein
MTTMLSFMRERYKGGLEVLGMKPNNPSNCPKKIAKSS